MRWHRWAQTAEASAARPVPHAATAAALRPGEWATSRAAEWGWLPALSVLAALGLLLVGLADAGARSASAWAVPMFWAGLLVVFAPIAARLASANASRTERVGLVIGLGLGLFLVKVLHNPVAFTFSDELSHWRTVKDIVQSSRLFKENPLLPVSALYPGLEIVTTAVTGLSGLPAVSAAYLVLAAARLVLALALYLFYEQVSRSPRVAGIGAALYMANPSFLFFDALFAYESLALPIAALVLAGMARLERVNGEGRLGLRLVALLGIGAAVATHHLTSYALAAFLALWGLVLFYRHYRLDLPGAVMAVVRWYAGEDSGRKPLDALAGQLALLRKRSAADADHLGVGGIALVAAVANLAWLVYVASLTLGYLSPVLGGAVTELLRLIAGESAGRELFRSGTGHVAPLLERLTGYASVGLILLGLPYGLWHTWRRYREKALALVLVGCALTYPATLAIRLTQAGGETAQRTSAFLFVAIAFVLAVGVVELDQTRRVGRLHHLVFAAWASIIFAGGVIVGWAAWARLPGPYVVGADNRSIEPQGIAAAEWVRDYLGPSHRLVTDRTNRLLMGSYGSQRPVRSGASAIFFSSEYGLGDRQFLVERAVRYVVFDRRLTQQLPEVGIYVERSEPDAYHHAQPIDPRTLAKFDGLPGVVRLFDSGDIAIYDLGAISDAP